MIMSESVADMGCTKIPNNHNKDNNKKFTQADPNRSQEPENRHLRPAYAQDYLKLTLASVSAMSLSDRWSDFFGV